MSFIPTIDDMEAEYDGVLLCTLGDDGDVIMAVTGDKAKALAAFTRYFREQCGVDHLLNDPDLTAADARRHMEVNRVLFHHEPADDQGTPTWITTAAAEWIPESVDVTYLHREPITADPKPSAQTEQFAIGDTITDSRCGTPVTGTVINVRGGSIYYTDDCPYCTRDGQWHRTQAAFPTTSKGQA